MKQFSIRLPNGLYEEIKKEAKKQKRTLNAQINILIEKIVQDEQKKETTEPSPTRR